MKRVGFEKARNRLADAFRAHEVLQIAKNPNEFDSAWTHLLTSLNSVYEILGKSSRGYPKSEVWFSRIREQRKADEALAYLHQARNVNDHGITSVFEYDPGGIAINGNESGLYIREIIGGPQGIVKFDGHSLDGSPAKFTQVAASFSLVPVVSRDGTYTPPEKFLGEKMEDNSPLGLAGKVLEFMVVLFVDAERLLAQS